MKKCWLLLPLCFLGFIACEKREVHSNEVQKVETEAVAQVFAQRLIAFQDELETRNSAPQWLELESRRAKIRKPEIEKPEALIDHLRGLGLQFDPRLVYDLEESLQEIKRQKSKGDFDHTTFATTLKKELNRSTTEDRPVPEVQVRAYYAPDCYMCCLREHDERRKEISNDLIKCMSVGGGLLGEAAGWGCVAIATYDIIDSNIKMQRCVNKIDN